MGVLLRKLLLWSVVLLLCLGVALPAYYTYTKGRFPTTSQEWREVWQLAQAVFSESHRQAQEQWEHWNEVLQIDERGQKLAQNFQSLLQSYRRHFDSQRQRQKELDEWIERIAHEAEQQVDIELQKATQDVERKRRTHALLPAPEPPKKQEKVALAPSKEKLSPALPLKSTPSRQPSPLKPSLPSAESSPKKEKEENSTSKAASPSQKAQAQREEKTREQPPSKATQPADPKVVLLVERGVEEFQKGRQLYTEAYNRRKSKLFPKAARHFQKAQIFLEKAYRLEKRPKEKQKLEELLQKVQQHIADCILLSRM